MTLTIVIAPRKLTSTGEFPPVCWFFKKIFPSQFYLFLLFYIWIFCNCWGFRSRTYPIAVWGWNVAPSPMFLIFLAAIEFLFVELRSHNFFKENIWLLFSALCLTLSFRIFFFGSRANRHIKLSNFPFLYWYLISWSLIIYDFLLHTTKQRFAFWYTFPPTPEPSLRPQLWHIATLPHNQSLFSVASLW